MSTRRTGRGIAGRCSIGPSATTCCEAAVTFDDFCELLDFEDMPEEILAKCAHFYLILPNSPFGVWKNE